MQRVAAPEPQGQSVKPGLVNNVYVAMLAWLMAPFAYLARLIGHEKRKFARNLDGFMNMGVFIGIITVILVALVSLLIIAELAPDYFTAIADLVNIFETSTTNNTTADRILRVLAIVVALGGVFGLVGLIFLAYRKVKGGGT